MYRTIFTLEDFCNSVPVTGAVLPAVINRTVHPDSVLFLSTPISYAVCVKYIKGCDDWYLDRSTEPKMIECDINNDYVASYARQWAIDHDCILMHDFDPSIPTAAGDALWMMYRTLFRVKE